MTQEDLFLQTHTEDFSVAVIHFARLTDRIAVLRDGRLQLSTSTSEPSVINMDEHSGDPLVLEFGYDVCGGMSVRVPQLCRDDVIVDNDGSFVLVESRASELRQGEDERRTGLQSAAEYMNRLNAELRGMQVQVDRLEADKRHLLSRIDVLNVELFAAIDMVNELRAAQNQPPAEPSEEAVGGDQVPPGTFDDIERAGESGTEEPEVVVDPPTAAAVEAGLQPLVSAGVGVGEGGEPESHV